MADSRPWAKIDTAYLHNPKWFQIERILHTTMANDMANDMAGGMASAIANAVRVAREAHLASILYSAQNQTDGMFPVRAIKATCMVSGPADEAAITALFDVGMWINHKGGMAEVRDYLEHQTPASLTKQRSEAGKKGAEARWGTDSKNGKSHQDAISKTKAQANAEEKRREEKLTTDNFAAWWPHYPKKVAKADALKAFKAAAKKVELPELIQATKQYARSVEGKDRKYVKNPGPWLRDERWTDELTPSPSPARSQASDRSAEDLDVIW